VTDPRHELIAELYNTPGWDALRSLVKEWRDGYYTQLGQAIYAGAKLEESDLDYKRGYWKALDRLLNQPKFSHDAVLRDLQRLEVNELD
jgi:hypothetical protein